MTEPADPHILKLNQPGVVIEVDRRTAEDLVQPRQSIANIKPPAVCPGKST
jgi:hypothetical protein